MGEQGKLYGSVTSLHIAEEVAKLIGAEELDHRKVLLPEAIKEVGIQPVRVRLTRNVEAAIEVEVLGEGEEPSAEEPEASAEEGEAEASEEAEAVEGEGDAGAETTEPEDEKAADEDQE